MKRCDHCKLDLPDDARYCKKCGRSVGGISLLDRLRWALAAVRRFVLSRPIRRLTLATFTVGWIPYLALATIELLGELDNGFVRIHERQTYLVVGSVTERYEQAFCWLAAVIVFWSWKLANHIDRVKMLAAHLATPMQDAAAQNTSET